MGKRYWEAGGEVKPKLQGMLRQREAALAEMVAFAKRNGTDKIGIRESLTTDFCLRFRDPPDPKVWKMVRGSDHSYVPKESSKAGKELAREMHAIAVRSPSGAQIGGVIGMKLFTVGGYWHTPGISEVGDRVLLSTPEEYKPPENLAGQLTRVSDLEYEKLTAEVG